jgi:hypothetical protein
MASTARGSRPFPPSDLRNAAHAVRIVPSHPLRRGWMTVPCLARNPLVLEMEAARDPGLVGSALGAYAEVALAGMARRSGRVAAGITEIFVRRVPRYRRTPFVHPKRCAAGAMEGAPRGGTLVRESRGGVTSGGGKHAPKPPWHYLRAQLREIKLATPAVWLYVGERSGGASARLPHPYTQSASPDVHCTTENWDAPRT